MDHAVTTTNLALHEFLVSGMVFSLKMEPGFFSSNALVYAANAATDAKVYTKKAMNQRLLSLTRSRNIKKNN